MAALTAAEKKALAQAQALIAKKQAEVAALEKTQAAQKAAEDAAAKQAAEDVAMAKQAIADAQKAGADAQIALLTQRAENAEKAAKAAQAAAASQAQAQTAAAAAAAAQATAAKNEAQRQSAISVLTERFTKYGLGSLVNKIKELAVDGATESTITFALQETDEYKQRFAANQARIKAGLQVLTPAEYLNVEDGYRQVLREYGLNQLATDDYVKKFIENDVSATELSTRVSTAVQRVQNADPAIARQLTEYYGIGQNDLVAYVLDPAQQITKIQRQVAAAEIGVAAARQGIAAGAGVAKEPIQKSRDL
jgi:hypothetical protein